LNGLESLIPDSRRVIFDSDIEEKYLSDTLGRLKGQAKALVFPESVREVSDIMKYAYEHKIPVTPRGAGTNLVGSTVPADGGIVLDLSRMNRVLEIDKDTFTATVEPGVVLKDFQELVEQEGLFYPPDPGEKTATIGGNISTNAGGMRAVKYGVTRDYIRGLEVVLADGSVAELGGKVVKDSSGLSLKHLMIGSEGTLGVITKAIVKLTAKPQESLSVLLPFDDLHTGIRAVLNVIRGNLDPTAIEFVEKKVVALGEEYVGLVFPYQDAAAYILLTFDGDDSEEIYKRVGKLKTIAKESGAKDALVLEDRETINAVWKIRGALVKAVEAKSEQEPVDIVVPINKSAEFIEYINDLEQKTGVQMVSFGHAGDGNVHLCVVRGGRTQEQWEKDRKEVLASAYDKSSELGGLTSGEHGIGLSKKKYLKKAADPLNLQMMKQVKLSLDPKKILNPNKIFD